MENREKNKNTYASGHQCPNCWGYQDYEGKSLGYTLKRSLGWIQDYVKKLFNI